MPRASIEQAIEAFARGEFVIIVDDEDRENEGDLCIAAEKITPDAVNFMTKIARGLICTPMSAEWTERLGLELMVNPTENGATFGTAFTVSVEAKQGTTTGISAFDRARTIKLLADPGASRSDFVMPGHTFPLRAHRDGVLGRIGQTEASVDLATLAGLPPVAVVCEIMSDDGTMARMPELEEVAAQHNIPVVTVADLVTYRSERERPVEQLTETQLPTEYGTFRVIAYQSATSNEPDLAMVLGDISGSEPVVARVHSECLTGDVFGSQRCDCGQQLDRALQRIGEEGRGVLLYMRQEGRGIGLLNKLRAYHLQDQGLDTVEANQKLGFQPDQRDYTGAAFILHNLGIEGVRLLTNNPSKVDALTNCGIRVVERLPLVIDPVDSNRRYLETKRTKMGHVYDVDPTDESTRTGTH
ncbi:MAG: bifunctional 3,4-dihydroxy-2-butanone-4-phosphate synthase/GTP cyclohydrolase II [Thermomicrobiaceae bacterium]